MHDLYTSVSIHTGKNIYQAGLTDMLPPRFRAFTGKFTYWLGTELKGIYSRGKHQCSKLIIPPQLQN